MTTLPLQRGILYGPVASRRLGRSLGVNLSPCRRKLCSFDCVYCHYGRSERLTTDPAPFVADLPSVDEVLAALGAALAGPIELDVVTFSGNGEPTLHPDFREIVDGAVELRDRHRPGTPLALLTNSSLLGDREAREAVSRLDLAICKLDAGTEEVFRAINRPVDGLDLEGVVEGLKAMKGIVLQTLLVDGEPGNVSAEAMNAYLDRVREIGPREVQIYSIDRPVASRRLLKVPPEELTRIAEMAEEHTGVTFRAFFPRGAGPRSRAERGLGASLSN